MSKKTVFVVWSMLINKLLFSAVDFLNKFAEGRHLLTFNSNAQKIPLLPQKMGEIYNLKSSKLHFTEYSRLAKCNKNLAVEQKQFTNSGLHTF